MRPCCTNRTSARRIPYYVSSSKLYPGKFMLSYLPRKTPKHEYVTVTPDGLRYRGQVFRSLGSLVRWFKEHFRDRVAGPSSKHAHTHAYAHTHTHTHTHTHMHTHTHTSMATHTHARTHTHTHTSMATHSTRTSVRSRNETCRVKSCDFPRKF